MSLDDVRAMMTVLAEVREKEALLDDIIGPVEAMYSMLASYEASSLRHTPRLVMEADERHT